MDNDGQYEVVIGSKDKRVYCLTGANGNLEWSYRKGGKNDYISIICFPADLC